jgi:PRC-barrel domain
VIQRTSKPLYNCWVNEKMSLHTLAAISLAATAFMTTPTNAESNRRPFILAQQISATADAKQDDSLEAKFNRRFPQKAEVGHLIGLPVLDDNDVTLGLVRKIVRTPEGRIKLIVSYSKWFGWFGRPVAVPIEAVTILGLQFNSVEMKPEDYEKAPTWSQGNDQILADSDIIRVALGRR